jgi:acetyl esterase/lipase
MPLDDDTRAFLDKGNQTTPPPPGSVPLAEFRAGLDAFKALSWDREELAEVRDVSVPVPGSTDVPVRLYRSAADGTPPLLVCVHGGSWVRLTVDQQDEYYRALANRSGLMIAAVDYTLSPESQLPGAIEEVLAVGRWAQGNAAELGADPERIGVMGESSGGNVVAAATQIARDRGDAPFAHQVLFVPCLDVRFESPSWDEFGAGFLIRRDALQWAVEQYAPGVEKTDPRVSPLCAEDVSDLPPALVITAEYDPLRDDGARYAERLKQAGVPVRYWQVPGLIHHAVMVPKAIPSAVAFMDELAATLSETLAGVAA